MASIVLNSTRLRSILHNRKKDADDVQSNLNLNVNLSEAIARDTVVEFDDIEKLAYYINKPWSYFLIDEPEVFEKGQDNRTLSNRRVEINDRLADVYREAKYMLEVGREVFPDDKIQRPTNLNSSLSPKETAKRIREYLRVTQQQQVETQDEYTALHLWINAIQARGVYVRQKRLRDDTVRAFSITIEDYAMMVVNTGDNAMARIFSVIHEYCHVIFNSTGICDLSEYSDIERYINELTAHILLPVTLIEPAIKNYRFGSDIEGDEETIKMMSKAFKVSQQALLIRLHGTGMIDDTCYVELENRRQGRRSDAPSSPGGNYYTNAINSVGQKFASNVMDALGENKINRADASVLLGVGEHLVQKFSEQLSQRLNRNTAQ